MREWANTQGMRNLAWKQSFQHAKYPSPTYLQMNQTQSTLGFLWDCGLHVRIKNKSWGLEYKGLPQADFAVCGRCVEFSVVI